MSGGQARSLLNSPTLTHGVEAAHTHPEADVVSLLSDLAAKAATFHGHDEADVVSLLGDLAAKASSTHSHPESDITSLLSDLAAKVALSTITGKGQLLAGSGSGVLGALATATDGWVLTLDSTQALGVKWATVVGGSGTVVEEFIGEPLMQDGASSPPVPLEVEAGTDWIYDDGTALPAPPTYPSGTVATTVPRPRLADLRDYGADSSGVTDNATAISNALAAISAYGGDVVFGAPGDYKVASTILLGNGTTSTDSTRGAMRLLGEGRPGAGTAPRYTTRLLWAGAATDPMISVRGILQGWGVENLYLDGGASYAGVGLEVISGQWGDARHLAFVNCKKAIWTKARALYGAYTSINCMHNRYRSLYIVIPTIAGQTTDGINIDGQAAGSNTCYDVFEDVTIAPPSSVATSVFRCLKIGACDNVRFRDLHVYALGSQSGSPILVLFDYSANAGWPSDTLIDTVDFGTGLNTSNGSALFQNVGVPSGGATKNRIINISATNGRPADPALTNLAWGLTASNP